MAEINKLIQIIEDEFDEVDKASVSPDTEIASVISLNSMNVAILITCIELDFGIIITAQQLKECTSFRELNDLISSITDVNA